VLLINKAPKFGVFMKNRSDLVSGVSICELPVDFFRI